MVELPSLETFQKPVELGDLGVNRAVLGQWLDSVILEGFSNLKNSIINSKCTQLVFLRGVFIFTK